MPLILSIETSTNVCSVALHQDGNLLACSEILIQKSHSQVLTILCSDLVKHCGAELKDLDAVAVSAGPGSYTGLRIGVSTAKGFCYSLDKPLLSVNTLEAMAFSLNQFNYAGNLVCPMIDARRMEVYALLADSKGNLLQPVNATVVDEAFLKDYLQDNIILFAGNGAAKCRSVLSYTPNAVFADDLVPSAKSVGVLAERYFNEGRFEDVIYFEPFYLKEFNSNVKGI